MNIIRDDELNGLMMIPILHEYGITGCMVEGCKEKANTVLSGYGEAAPIGICEKHYQQAKEQGQFKYKIVFDQHD